MMQHLQVGNVSMVGICVAVETARPLMRNVSMIVKQKGLDYSVRPLKKFHRCQVRTYLMQ